MVRGRVGWMLVCPWPRLETADATTPLNSVSQSTKPFRQPVHQAVVPLDVAPRDGRRVPETVSPSPATLWTLTGESELPST